MMMKKILIILKKEGFETEAAYDGGVGLELAIVRLTNSTSALPICKRNYFKGIFKRHTVLQQIFCDKIFVWKSGSKGNTRKR